MSVSKARSILVVVFLMSFLLLLSMACGLLTGSTPEMEPTLAAAPSSVEQGADDLQAEDSFCSGAEVHPVGESIAATYEIPYEEVMRLHCDGHEFEEVLLALETQEQSGESAQSILQKRENGLTWDEIWQDLGLVEQ